MHNDRLTKVQLRQKVIYLQSEMSKYREKIKDYEENYHYQMLNELKSENASLLEKVELLERSFQENYERKSELEQEIKELKEKYDNKIQENEVLHEQLNEKEKSEERDEDNFSSSDNQSSPFNQFIGSGKGNVRETKRKIDLDESNYFTRNIKKQLDKKKE